MMAKRGLCHSIIGSRPLKIYILTDLEGVAMVSRFSQTREEGPQKQAPAMRLLTQEINAAVDGILDVDADAEIVVWDGHGTGGIEVLEFHPEAKVNCAGTDSSALLS